MSKQTPAAAALLIYPLSLKDYKDMTPFERFRASKATIINKKRNKMPLLTTV
jgi:hypothetical protein